MDRSMAEFLAVLATGILNIMAYPKYFMTYILVAGLGWGAYALWRVRQTTESDPKEGESDSNEVESVDKPSSPKEAWALTNRVALGMLVVALIAVAAGCFPLRQPDFWRSGLFWLCLLLYPLFGILQQYIIQKGLTHNLEKACQEMPKSIRTPFIVFVVTALFSAAHCYEPELVKASAVLGIASTWTYLQTHRIMPIGIYHGLFGAVFYYLVMGRDVKWLLAQLNLSPIG